jgi:putative spermidine/putrescine transport system substrate-binding protein
VEGYALRAKPWLVSVLGLMVVGLAAPSATAVSAKSVTTLNLFDDGDTNIEQLWNLLIPQYEKLHPNIKINLIWNQHGTDDNAIYARMVASMQAHKADPFDITDAGFIEQGQLAHEFVTISLKSVPNLKYVDPAIVAENLDQSAPYRGSEVVLAYNSATVKNPPATLNQVISWIEANPGKFDYADPSVAGSGDAFVQAITERGFTTQQLAEFQSATAYNPKLESIWKNGLDFLAKLGKDTYRGGYYPDGNTQILTLLAQGAIQMATVWSDQGTAALISGQLPKTVKLEQLKTPFYGSPTTIAVPKNSAHVADALAFINWVLAPAQQVTIMNYVSGFPGIEWKYLPASERAKFKTVEAPYFTGMSAKYDSDLVEQWQTVVADAAKG